MRDFKYSLEIMKQELDNKHISPEVKYAFKTSIKALELQMSERVVGISATYDGLVGNCPTCDKFIRQKENEHYHQDEECGQKLLWK